MGRGMEVLQNLQKFQVRAGSQTELTEVPGIVFKSHKTHKSSGRVYDCCTDYHTGTPVLCEVLGTGYMPRYLPYFLGIYPTQRPRAGMGRCARTPGVVARAYRTCRSFGYGYESHTELTEVPSTGINVVRNLQKVSVG